MMSSSFRLLFAAAILSVCGFSEQRSAAQNREADKPVDQGETNKTAEVPDQAALAKLVRQLGSEDIRERNAATKALAVIGPPALEILRKAAKDSDAPPRSGGSCSFTPPTTRIWSTAGLG